MFGDYYQVRDWLEGFIPQTYTAKNLGLERIKYLLKLLDNPQDKFKSIHIAGTSGKGSTAYVTSSLLLSHGLKVGMGISPHVHDLLERIQINMSPISNEMFCKYLNEIVPFIEAMKTTKYGQITYFEIIIGLSYYIFLKEKTDVVVMETGLGGRYCATNTVTSSNKIAVITQIGFDHMEFLGNTLTSISFEKAKIIQPHNITITLKQEPDAMIQIQNEASLKKAKLIILNPGQNIKNIRLTSKNTVFDFEFENIRENNLEVSLLGEYQTENASLALLAFKSFMDANKKSIEMSKVRKILKHIFVPGRMEIRKYNGKEIIIDGAHNGQKMEAFVNSLMKVYPNQKFTFLISFKKGKDYESILKHVFSCAETIIITSFNNKNQGMGQLYSETPANVAKVLDKLSFKNYLVIPDLQKAFAEATSKNNKVVITGSLYLVGEIYDLLEK